MADPTFSIWERVALGGVLSTAVLGLFYAAFLAVEVLGKDQGTEAMQKISGAIRLGANAYLIRQLKALSALILIIAALLYFTTAETHIAWGRALAFLMGASFSFLVGFIGMNMAVQGNVRVAAAARTSFAEALKIAYRTGTITGMLTDGLGLLGGAL
ncbi:MAG: sodium/proton-translocating pyrophosphatase, partial [Candidatus Omnitrophica bacterium]|nr:sodium/proton-translocating pyrophosphatase [Candidatus Omnitrophota bacterium]